MINKLTQEEASNLAGIIDGDGSIIAQIKLNEAAGYRFKHQIQLTLQVTQLNKRRGFLENIQRLIGAGNVRDRSDISDYILTAREDVFNILEQITPFLSSEGKKQQSLLMQEMIILMRDSDYTRDPAKFLKICEISDKISLLNDSKNRKINADTVREKLREMGYIQ